MYHLTRRSLLRTSLGAAAAAPFAHPYIANAQAKTATVWWSQGFVPEEDEAFKKMVADYEKLSGNKIDHSIVPFANETDRKSTRLNSSHLGISYAVFCLKKKKKKS